MRRSAVLSLREVQFVKLPGDSLEIGIQPSEAGALAALTLFGALSPEAAAEVCKRVFVDFKNYTDDDGKAVPNTLEARLELFSVAAVRQRVQSAVTEIHERVLEGEGSAASD